jgi:hypothetical protein
LSATNASTAADTDSGVISAMRPGYGGLLIGQHSPCFDGEESSNSSVRTFGR